MDRIRARLTALWRRPITAEGYRVVTAVALVALGAIVVSGAAVRLTGSGMGCPTWPTCEDGSLVPRGATGGHGWVEFLNRTFTGAVSVAVALAVLGSRRLRTPRPDLTALSWALVGGVFAQALLGGLVVLLDVTPLAVAGHYLLSAVLVATAVVLHHRAGLPAGPRRPAATPSVLRLEPGARRPHRRGAGRRARWSRAAARTGATRPLTDCPSPCAPSCRSTAVRCGCSSS